MSGPAHQPPPIGAYRSGDYAGAAPRDPDELITGEAVALDLRLARAPSRVLATLIDLGVEYAALVACLSLGIVVLSGADTKIAGAVEVTLVVFILIGYPVIFETITRGRTLGKMALGIRVVRDDGGPIAFRQALVRGVMGALLEKPGLLFPVTAPIGLIVMLVSSRAKRVGDLAAGTVVMQERVPGARRPPPVAEMPPMLAGWARSLDLTRLDDGLALSVRQFLHRAAEMRPEAADRLGRALADTTLARVTPNPPPNTSATAFLQAVIGERRRRAEERAAAAPPRLNPMQPRRNSIPPRVNPMQPRYGQPSGLPYQGTVSASAPRSEHSSGDVPSGDAPQQGPFAPPG